MSDDESGRPPATSEDVSRLAATSDDSEYSLSIEEAIARYEVAGIPRTARSVQRYCAKGDLDAHRIDTPFGEKFLIKPAFVDRHIAYINEVRPVATSRDLPRPVTTDVATERSHGISTTEPTTGDDKQRPAATEGDVSRPVAAEKRIVELLESENRFLRDQIVVKDRQIADQLERAHEMNVLVGGLQRMLGPLLGAPEAKEDRVKQ